jgi:hypothetical protein
MRKTVFCVVLAATVLLPAQGRAVSRRESGQGGRAWWEVITQWALALAGGIVNQNTGDPALPNAPTIIDPYG